MQKIVLTNENYDDFISESQDVTYAQLSVLITTSTLEPGRKYRITDYATAYNIFDGGTNTVIEAQLGTAEPLIVTATGTSTLAKEAYSELYPQDIIYYNPLVNAVDRAAFLVAGDVGYVTAGSLVAGFKGIIEFRHDTKQNVSTWYDFRNIKFRRFALDAAVFDKFYPYTTNEVSKGSDGKIYKCTNPTTGEANPTSNTADWILWWDLTIDAHISWTTNLTSFNLGNILTTNLLVSALDYQDVYTFGEWYPRIRNVTIGKIDLQSLSLTYQSSLNNIVFKTDDAANTCCDIKIGNNSFLGTLQGNFVSNIFGDFFTQNIIGVSCNFNTVDQGFEKNVIGQSFYYNTIDQGFVQNVIGSDCNYNTIQTGFAGNNIKGSFTENTIGSLFAGNTTGIQFRFNHIGYDFSGNKFSGEFKYNIVGSRCTTNIFGSSSYYNHFGNYIHDNSFGGNLNYNNFGNNLGSSSIGIEFRYNTVGHNSVLVAGDTCESNCIGSSNTSVTLGSSCTGVSIGEMNGTIELGAGCTGISIGEHNGTIELGAVCIDIIIGNGNPNILLGSGSARLVIGCNNTISMILCSNSTFKSNCYIIGNTNDSGLQNVTFENSVILNALDFAAATHIKAAYSKTVFMNATPVAKLSYFDAANALTVVDVNA